MRYTVRYIPLSKIKSDVPGKMTAHIRELRRVMRDCMQLLVVRKSGKDGYLLLTGHDRYEFYRKHTRKMTAPCLIDESKSKRQMGSWMHTIRNRRLLQHFPEFKPDRMAPPGWAIARAFLKEEPRFKRLTRTQQLKVLILALRYKRTVITAMKSKVDQWTGSLE